MSKTKRIVATVVVWGVYSLIYYGIKFSGIFPEWFDWRRFGIEVTLTTLAVGVSLAFWVMNGQGGGGGR